MLFASAVGFLAGFQIAKATQITATQSSPATRDHHHSRAPYDLRASNVLVLYSFFDGDEMSWDNMLFFLKHAVQPSDGAEYVIILNGQSSTNDARLPELPINARYVLHSNECYDWGTYAWALTSQAKADQHSCALPPLLLSVHTNRCPMLTNVVLVHWRIHVGALLSRLLSRLLAAACMCSSTY